MWQEALDHDVLTAPWEGTRHGPGGSKTQDTEDTSPHLGVVRKGRTEAGAEATLPWAVPSSPARPFCPSLTRSPVRPPRQGQRQQVLAPELPGEVAMAHELELLKSVHGQALLKKLKLWHAV